MANGLQQYIGAFMDNGFDCMEVVEELGTYALHIQAVCCRHYLHAFWEVQQVARLLGKHVSLRRWKNGT